MQNGLPVVAGPKLREWVSGNPNPAQTANLRTSQIRRFQMADRLEEIAKKSKEREAVLTKLQNAAKAAESVTKSHNELANTLKVAQGVLKAVND
jgi:hypothetical protein